MTVLLSMFVHVMGLGQDRGSPFDSFIVYLRICVYGCNGALDCMSDVPFDVLHLHCIMCLCMQNKWRAVEQLKTTAESLTDCNHFSPQIVAMAAELLAVWSEYLSESNTLLSLCRSYVTFWDSCKQVSGGCVRACVWVWVWVCVGVCPYKTAYIGWSCSTRVLSLTSFSWMD